MSQSPPDDDTYQYRFDSIEARDRYIAVTGPMSIPVFNAFLARLAGELMVEGADKITLSAIDGALNKIEVPYGTN